MTPRRSWSTARWAIPVLILSFSAFSCRREPEGPTRVLKSTRVDTPPPPDKEARPTYTFQISEPTSRPFGVGEPIPCQFTVTVPHAEKPPSFVFLQILKGDRGEVIAGTMAVEPKGEPVGGVYDFEASIEAPRSPGPYRLRVHALRGVLYTGGSSSPEMRYTDSYSSPISIPITKGK